MRITGKRKKSRTGVRAACLLLAVVLLLPSAGNAGGSWYAAEETGLPEDIGFLPCEYTGTVTVTFLGDCTLGGEEKSRKSALGFARRAEENGLEFPLRGLLPLTGTDDITVANLEGVLTDRNLKKVSKKYNFSGPAAYAEILTAGGVDCVTLANNHSHDYGEEGYADTQAALDRAGVHWFGTDTPALWRGDEGILIGFLGVSYSLTGDRYARYAAQAKKLRDMGCAAVVTVMHAGTEYRYAAPDKYQRQIVSRAAACGTDLIIGHHPHVVQGYDIVDGVPVVYSLGNCSFGGTTHAKDSDALAVRADLQFEEGNLAGITLRFYPVSITSDDRYNNYAPRLLDGEEAERVLEKMRKSTGRDPGTWNPQTGTVVTVQVPVR